MKEFGFAVLMIAIVLAQGQWVSAHPNSGANCANCHTDGSLGTMTVTGNDKTADPTEGCGTTNLGSLKVFRVTQGSTKTLSGTLSGVPSGASYATVVKGFERAGVQSCGALSYTADIAWKQQNKNPLYFTQPLSGTYSASSTPLNFNITVGATTPPDYYDLVLASAGVHSGMMHYSEAHVYVEVVAAPPPPDCNQNGVPDSQDIANGTSKDCDGNGIPDECGCSAVPADIDGDSDVDLTDFGAFQRCFNGPNRLYILGANPCHCLDIDHDCDVDLGDFTGFQGCFNGPNRAAKC